MVGAIVITISPSKVNLESTMSSPPKPHNFMNSSLQSSVCVDYLSNPMGLVEDIKAISHLAVTVKASVGESSLMVGSLINSSGNISEIVNDSIIDEVAGLNNQTDGSTYNKLIPILNDSVTSTKYLGLGSYK